jgi:hypothetical protein
MAQPLILILARNFAENIQLASFLIDVEGSLVFFNDTASALIGHRFKRPDRWYGTSGRRDSARSTVTANRSRWIHFRWL